MLNSYYAFVCVSEQLSEYGWACLTHTKCATAVLAAAGRARVKLKLAARLLMQ